MLKVTPGRLAAAGTSLLVLIFVALVFQFGGDPRAADEPYLTEVPLFDGIHRVRLLSTNPGELTYQWKAPLVTRIMMRTNFRTNDRLFDIDLKPFRHTDTFPASDLTSFLFRMVNNQNQWANPRGYGFLRYQFVESTGFVFPPDGRLEWQFQGGAQLVQTTAFPCRDKELTIRVTTIEEKTPNSKQFTIPNPYYRDDFPVWSPETLPVVKTRNGMTVELKDMGYSGRSFHPTILQRLGNDQIHFSTYFAVVEDATGNRCDSFSGLSPFEPAWKVVANVFPAPSAPFSDDHVQLVGKFRIPKYGVIVLVNRTVTVGGIPVIVRLVCGGGKVERCKGHWTASSFTDRQQVIYQLASERPFVVIEVKDIPKGHGILVRSRTEKGSTSDMLQNFNSGSPSCVKVLDRGDTSEEFMLDLVDCKSEQFEFIVEPPQSWRDEITSPQP